MTNGLSQPNRRVHTEPDNVSLLLLIILLECAVMLYSKTKCLITLIMFTSIFFIPYAVAIS